VKGKGEDYEQRDRIARIAFFVFMLSWSCSSFLNGRFAQAPAAEQPAKPAAEQRRLPPPRRRQHKRRLPSPTDKAFAFLLGNGDPKSSIAPNDLLGQSRKEFKGPAGKAE